MKANYLDEEDTISGEFKTVPIERSQYGGVEVYNIYSGISYSKERLKRKIFRYSLTIILIIVFIIITKTLLWDGIVELFSDDGDSYENSNSNYNDSFGDVDAADNPLEKFYLEQNISEIDLNSFSSPQFRKPENIKIVNKVEMSLSVEYDKFVHMKIKDAENPRWEVPETDILNEDYLSAVENNRISLSYFAPKKIRTFTNNVENPTKRKINKNNKNIIKIQNENNKMDSKILMSKNSNTNIKIENFTENNFLRRFKKKILEIIIIILLIYI
jgi:cytoskeletal protein RodZ